MIRSAIYDGLFVPRGTGWYCGQTHDGPSRTGISRSEGGILITEHYIGGLLVSVTRKLIEEPEPRRVEPAA